MIKFNPRLILSGLLTLLSPLALADRSDWAIREFPFGKFLNMNTVYEVTHSKPSELISFIRKHNVDIQVVPSDLKTNPTFKLLPKTKLTKEQLLKIEFDDETDGMVVFKGNDCCNFTQDTILIRDTASSYHLIHEFLHTQFKTKGRDSQRVGDQFLREHKTLNFRQQKIFRDSIKLVDSRWRRDMLSSAKDYSDLLYSKIQESQAEEAIIEKILSRYIDKNSPYYDAQLAKQSLQYGENSVNNAIDLYNYVFEVLNSNKGNVLRYRDEIKNNHLIPEMSQDLSEQQAQDFAIQSDNILKDLKRTEHEIIKLKKFYSE